MKAEEALQLAKAYTRKTMAGSGGSKGDKGDDGKSAYEFAKDGGYTGTEEEFSLKLATENLPLCQGAGYHNSVYRGKFLGDTVTEEQYAVIKTGTFDDLFIGDYWTIDGINWRIAAFDYYYKSGDVVCDTHHVTIVPDEILYRHPMNDTDITTGAYVGSKMYTSGLDEAKNMINKAFGSEHILNHRRYLQNATSSGYSSGGSWYDSIVELMTEQNVYGCKILCDRPTGSNVFTTDKTQYPLFRYNYELTSNRQEVWLRDVASSAAFGFVSSGNLCNRAGADNSTIGVRPSFSICEL